MASPQEVLANVWHGQRRGGLLPLPRHHRAGEGGARAQRGLHTGRYQVEVR